MEMMGGAGYREPAQWSKEASIRSSKVTERLPKISPLQI